MGSELCLRSKFIWRSGKKRGVIMVTDGIAFQCYGGLERDEKVIYDR